jgi:hypothetical protein
VLTSRRLIATRRSPALLPAVVVLVLLAIPAVAGAHLRSGTVAVDYRASVTTRDPAAYTAQIFQSDRALNMTVKPGHIVVLVGYLGEPVFRLDDAGLWVNAASPTAVVLRLLAKSERVVGSAPHWRLQPGRQSVVWQDARTQGLPPGVRHGSWAVPVIVDGRRSRLQGELWHFAAPSPWPWLGLLAALLAAGLVPLVLRRRDLGGRAASVLAIAATTASVVILAAFAFDAYASPGTWIEAIDAIAFLGVGVWVLLRGPPRWRLAGAIGLGLVALAVALLEVPIFLHSIVLAILPGGAVRFLDVVALGAGLDAAALGCLFYVETAGRLPGASSAPELPVDRVRTRR